MSLPLNAAEEALNRYAKALRLLAVAIEANRAVVAHPRVAVAGPLPEAEGLREVAHLLDNPDEQVAVKARSLILQSAGERKASVQTWAMVVVMLRRHAAVLDRSPERIAGAVMHSVAS